MHPSTLHMTLPKKRHFSEIKWAINDRRDWGYAIKWKKLVFNDVCLYWSVNRKKKTKKRTSKGCCSIQGLKNNHHPQGNGVKRKVLEPNDSWSYWKGSIWWRNAAFFCNHRVNQAESRQKFSLFPSALESPTRVSQWLNLPRSQKVMRCHWCNRYGYRAGHIRDRLGLVVCQFCNKVSKVWLFLCASTSRHPSLS